MDKLPFGLHENVGKKKKKTEKKKNKKNVPFLKIWKFWFWQTLFEKSEIKIIVFVLN